MGSAYQFHSWRVFVLVCAFPSVFAIGALTTMPESPRFYLEVGVWGGTAVSWGGSGTWSRGWCEGPQTGTPGGGEVWTGNPRWVLEKGGTGQVDDGIQSGTPKGLGGP